MLCRGALVSLNLPRAALELQSQPHAALAIVFRCVAFLPFPSVLITSSFTSVTSLSMCHPAGFCPIPAYIYIYIYIYICMHIYVYIISTLD